MADGNPPYDARFQVFRIVDNDASTTRDLSKFLTGIDGIPGTRELLDTTMITSSGRTFTSSVFNGTFVLEGNYDQSASTGPDIVLNNILVMSTATSFVYAPAGTDCGQTPVSRQYQAACWIRSYTITGRVASVITFRSEGQIEGSVTVADSSDFAN